jgi:hypothetical protein
MTLFAPNFGSRKMPAPLSEKNFFSVSEKVAKGKVLTDVE